MSRQKTRFEKVGWVVFLTSLALYVTAFALAVAGATDLQAPNWLEVPLGLGFYVAPTTGIIGLLILVLAWIIRSIKDRGDTD